MNIVRRTFPALRSSRRAERLAERARTLRPATLVQGAAVVIAFTLVTLFSAVPLNRAPQGSGAEASAALSTTTQSTPTAEAEGGELVQTLVASGRVATPDLTRDTFTVTPGRASFIAGGTNYDWAKLVLSYGGWPVTDNNVTVIVRWMRQENYLDTWWNRNNPLNNGWGSGGGSGLGSYPSLAVAAENAAEALNTLAGYAPIREAFAASSPTEVTEHAIWGSPWASGHYAGGSHWHYSEVPVVAAPPGAW